MTWEEARAAGHGFSYGFSQDPKWQEQLKAEVGPNPTQYDIEMFFFLNHAQWATGIPRDEHWWRAKELRWPTVQAEDGKLTGSLVRTPWNERIIWAAANFGIVNMMGGAGQGKTTTPMAFGITIWDYFEKTESGARFIFSSVNENKLKDAAWATVASLYQQSVICSSNVGNGQILDGSFLIKRKKLGGTGKGIIKGILVPNDARSRSKIEAITGAHVPTAQILAIDEAQGSPDAIDRAAYNLRMHAKFFWLFRMGNPDKKDDYLGKSCKPDKGWETVDPTKFEEVPLEWESSYDGQRAYVLRFDNELSPGIEDPTAFWFLPTRAKIDAIYKTHASRQTAEFWRFNRAWFPPEWAEDSVIKWSIIEQQGCHRFCTAPKGQPTPFISFDPAPKSLDRSPLTRCELIFDGDKEVLNFINIHYIPKVAGDLFYNTAVEVALEKATEWGVRSGNFIYDDTSVSGFQTMMRNKGFDVVAFQYSNKSTEKSIEPNIPKPANTYVANVITEAALLMEAYIRHGQIRGLNESLIKNFMEEICSRKLSTHAQSNKIKLESKPDFRATHGFSPDILDTLFQACWFARERLGFYPGVDRKPKPSYPNRVVMPSMFTRKFLTH
jgi:hypothetical protein